MMRWNYSSIQYEVVKHFAPSWDIFLSEDIETFCPLKVLKHFDPKFQKDFGVYPIFALN